MPKQKNETYQQYMGRVVNAVSPSFCAAKWWNATIWLGSGTTASCHHPPAHRIDPEAIKSNPAALHNTSVKKVAREQMLKGERPSECDYCWKVEDMKRDSVSDRAFKTVIYSDAEVAEAASTPVEQDVALKTLEIAFDRTCNFACSYCNASFSTTWAKDIKTHGPYQNLLSDGAGAFQHDGGWSQPHKAEDNPYIDAFWRWWPVLQHSLTELRVTGGEPLMAPDVWKLLDKFAEEDLQIRLSINSNLGAKDDLIDRLIEKSQHIQALDIYTSNESMGVQAEYIRDGLDYAVWERNCIRLMTEGKLRSFHAMMTINGLCLFGITDFMDRLLEWKATYGMKKAPIWSVNILRFPSFMSPLALPNHIKDERREHLRVWLADRGKNPLMSEGERESVQRLIDYLEVVNDPHRTVSSMESRHRDFRTFHEQHDKRRGKDIRAAFPGALTDWLDSLPITVTGKRTELIDGDSTKNPA